MKITLKLIAGFIFTIVIYGCAADLHKTCVKYVEKLESQEICDDVEDEVDCTHAHGGVEHSCTANYSDIRRICRTEKVKVRKCTKYICKAGYQRNSKNHCVKHKEL